MFSLQIDTEQLLKLYELAENALPNESVVLLFGKLVDDIVIVTRIEFVNNESDSPVTSFAVNPEEQYRLFLEAEERGEELVAIFHSHPAPLKPSARDIKFMKLNPVVWLIASRSSGSWETRAFILKDDIPLEVPITKT